MIIRAHSYELVDEPWRSLIDDVAGNLHSDQAVEAAKLAMEATGVKGNPEDEGFRTQVFQGLLTWCLSRRHYMDAAVLMWPKNMFFSNPVPRFTQLAWGALDRWDGLMFQGGASTSKTYGCGVYFFLDWLADPEYTTVRVAGPSENHLQDNLFSHLVNLHQNSAIPLPGTLGDLFIGLSLRNRRSAISGVVFPLGRRPAGRLQGTKRFPRPSPHPIFGPLSRLRVLLDEVEHMPPGVWSDLDNVLANTGEDEAKEGLKIASAYNPKDPAGPCGVRAEPEKGHANVDADKDECWVSRRGWMVVRLDGEKCENVLARQEIFPGLQTGAGLARLAQSTGGRGSPNYATFGRGMFPAQGAAFTVITPASVAASRGNFVWHSPPVRCGGADLALEGGDKPIFAIGELGLATGIRRPPTLEFPTGRVVPFLDAHGRQILRYGLCCTSLIQMIRGRTEDIARQVREIAYRAGIEPHRLAVDRTGHTAGVHDLLVSSWSPQVIGVNFSASPSSLKILQESQKAAEDEFDRVVSELWFALAGWVTASAFLIDPSVDLVEVVPQLTGRLYDAHGVKMKVESKRDYKHRNQGKSPDEAEAMTLLTHAARMSSRIVPSMQLTGPADGASVSGQDDEPMYYRVDVTNRIDDSF